MLNKINKVDKVNNNKAKKIIYYKKYLFFNTYI